MYDHCTLPRGRLVRSPRDTRRAVRTDLRKLTAVCAPMPSGSGILKKLKSVCRELVGGK